MKNDRVTGTLFHANLYAIVGLEHVWQSESCPHAQCPNHPNFYHTLLRVDEEGEK